MKKLFGFLFLFALVGLSACGDDSNEPTTGSLQLNFILEYEGEPLVMNETLTYENGLPMNYSRVNMYLSNFILGDRNLADIAFLDFTDVNVTAGQAQAGQFIQFDEIPAGDYGPLQYSVGVPKELNAQKPADFPAGHPLALTSEYWAGWNSYIFAKYEGKLDLEGDEMLETGFTFHTGSDPVFRSLTFDRNISINANETTTINFVINAKEMFHLEDGFLDLTEIQGAHNEGAMDLMMGISDNYVSAISIKE